MRYFFAKSLIVIQIRLFRLFPPFSLFQRIRLLDFSALVKMQESEVARMLALLEEEAATALARPKVDNNVDNTFLYTALQRQNLPLSENTLRV